VRAHEKTLRLCGCPIPRRKGRVVAIRRLALAPWSRSRPIPRFVLLPWHPIGRRHPLFCYRTARMNRGRLGVEARSGRKEVPR